MNVSLLSFAFFVFACGSDKGVTVFNPNPEAAISSHVDGDEVFEGQVITFIGNVSDANHSPDKLTAIWKSGADILCEASAVNFDGTSVCEAVLAAGEAEITLEVKDSENAPGSDTISIDVIPSAHPIAEIVAPHAQGTYYSDQLITFEGLLSDAEDSADVLVANWNSSVDGDLFIAAAPNSAGEVLGAAYLSQGDHFLVLTVEDTTGKEGSDNVTIQVGPPNSAPLCSIVTPADGSAGPFGSGVEFTARVSDVDISAPLLSVAWVSDKDGVIGSSIPDGAGNVLFPFADLSVNTHVISMIVTDEMDAACVSNITYTVGTPPAVAIDSPANGDVIDEGASILFLATVSDAQDPPDVIALDWRVNGTSISSQGAASSGVAGFSDSTLSHGTYNLVLTATDTDGLTDSDQINFTINGPPSQPEVSIIPNPATTSDTLTVSVDVPSVDPEAHVVNYSFEWRKGGLVQPSYTSNTVPPSATSKGQQWTVHVTPNDGISNGPVGEATISIANTAPTLSGLAMTPTSNVYNDTIVTCSVIVTDPDETVTPTYEWSIGSTLAGSGSTLVLSAAGAMPNDVVTCSASAIDGDGNSVSDSISTTVENRLPVVTSVSIAPSAVYTLDSVIAAAILADDDTQVATGEYEWHVVDVSGVDTVVQQGSGDTLDGSLHFDRDEEIYAVVTPNDGISDGISVTSNSVVVSNTAPVAPSISISPNPAVAGQDDLVCSVDVSSSDDDGDAVVYTYVWRDDSGTIQKTTTNSASTSDTFVASGTSEGTWTCDVTPHDMTDDGPSVSAVVAVDSGCSSLYFQSESASVPASSDFVFTHTLTIETWLKWENDGRNWYPIVQHGWGTWDSLFYFALTGSDQGCSVTHQTGTPYFEFKTAVLGHCFYADAALPENEWVHVAVVFDHGLLRMFVQGEEVKSQSVSPSQLSSVPPVDLGIGFSPTSGNSYFYGSLSHLQLTSAARYSGDFSLADTFVHDSSTAAFWALDEGIGTVVYDGSGNGHHGTNNGALWVDSCPEEDVDGDGAPSWEDCDDGNASVTIGGTGTSEVCAAETCKSILDDGYSTGDGIYWVDPDGAGGIEVYCDMTTDGGGWTLVGSWANMSGYAMENYTQGRNTHLVPSAHQSPLSGGGTSSSGPSHYSSSIFNALFHQGSQEYLTLTGSQYLGAAVVRFSKNLPDSGYDAFRGVYETSYMMDNDFTAVEQGFTANQNPLPLGNPSWSPVVISARTTTSGNYHYLPDDITESYQWLFRENVDDTPNSAQSHSSNVPSLLWIR